MLPFTPHPSPPESGLTRHDDLGGSSLERWPGETVAEIRPIKDDEWAVVDRDAKEVRIYNDKEWGPIERVPFGRGCDSMGRKFLEIKGGSDD